MSTSDYRSLLDELARHGLEAVPAMHLAEVATECDARARVSGDARYPVLEHLFRDVLDWWSDHDERGGIPTPVASEIDSTIRQRLPVVLGADLPTDGYAAAVQLAHTLRPLLLGPEEWIARGYLAPSTDP